MPKKTSLHVSLTKDQRETLELWQRSSKVPSGLVKRGRILLLLAAGKSVSATALAVGMARRLVYEWTRRFHRDGIEGLRDKPRPGRTPVFSP